MPRVTVCVGIIGVSLETRQMVGMLRSWRSVGSTNKFFVPVLFAGTQTVPVGEGPIVAVIAERYLAAMNPLLLIIILLMLFGGGGYYAGGPAYGGGGIGLIVLICLIIYLMGGWRTKK